MDVTTHIDDELMRAYRSRRGHPDARVCLEELLDRYQGRIAAWCLHVVRDKHDAADCAQEAMLRIYRSLHQFRGNSEFSTWAYTVTRRACLDTLAAKEKLAARETPMTDEIESIPDRRPVPLASMADEEAKALLKAVLLAHMTPRESEVMTLHHVEGKSVKTISTFLGLVNRSGARAFLTRAKRKLRENLSPQWMKEFGLLMASEAAKVVERQEGGGTDGRK